MAENRIWSVEDTLKLINSYESLPELWDVYSAGYKNKTVKNIAWAKLASEFETNILEIQRKIHNLKNQYNQENKRIQKQKPGQQYSEDNYVSKWKYFNALRFLDSVRHSSDSNHLKLEETHEHFLLENSSSTDSNEISPSRKRRRLLTLNQDIFKKTCSAGHSGCHTNDEYDVFGMYVASELKSLRNESSRRRLKQIIRRAVVEVAEFDEEYDDMTGHHSEINECEQKPHVLSHPGMGYVPYGLEVIDNDVNR